MVSIIRFVSLVKEKKNRFNCTVHQSLHLAPKRKSISCTIKTKMAGGHLIIMNMAKTKIDVGSFENVRSSVLGGDSVLEIFMEIIRLDNFEISSCGRLDRNCLNSEIM